ncbi:hypothetical protein [Gracilibacillus timonensis]|uniref:hypothetical protein n=1 Tax=Gracilibacillus timonensis TaxID=1816696 RepID=UPI0008262AA5|nr:hypothetical protein [Gracilibacillus timonensis]
MFVHIFFEAINAFIPSEFLVYQQFDVGDDLEEITDIEVFYSSTRGMYTSGGGSGGYWVKYDDGTMICRYTIIRNNLTLDMVSGAI